MKHSDSIATLAASLAKAQSEITAVAKDSTNPHFRNKYASLDNILAQVRPILSKHGLSLIQGMGTPHTDEAGRIQSFVVETMLLHASGEYVSNAAIMPVVKSDPQGVGGALTYGRRYGVSALLSIATEEDDDGQAASRPRHSPPAPSRPAPVALGDGNGEPPTEKQVGFLRKLMASSVFTEDERKRIEAKTTSKDLAKRAIEWAQGEIETRKAAA